MRAKKLILQIVAIAAVIALFAGYNAVIYTYLTRRCGNNYSSGSQPKMVDVKKYLPFEDGSELARVETDIKITGDLPVLDGAAALVPVYASFINAVYPEGSVKYEGGVFSDDNYYGVDPECCFFFENGWEERLTAAAQPAFEEYLKRCPPTKKKDKSEKKKE